MHIYCHLKEFESWQLNWSTCMPFITDKTHRRPFFPCDPGASWAPSWGFPRFSSRAWCTASVHWGSSSQVEYTVDGNPNPPNPNPQLIGGFSQGFNHPRWCRVSSTHCWVDGRHIHWPKWGPSRSWFPCRRLGIHGVEVNVRIWRISLYIPYIIYIQFRWVVWCCMSWFLPDSISLLCCALPRFLQSCGFHSIGSHWGGRRVQQIVMNYHNYPLVI
jgi:hypothetical protein